jgi:hypothetical protein
MPENHPEPFLGDLTRFLAAMVLRLILMTILVSGAGWPASRAAFAQRRQNGSPLGGISPLVAVRPIPIRPRQMDVPEQKKCHESPVGLAHPVSLSWTVSG